MERSIKYGDKEILLIKEVPHSVYANVLLTLPPESSNPSEDIITALRILLGHNRMATVWVKLEKAAADRRKEFTDTTVASMLDFSFSLFLHLYRKREATSPATVTGRATFQDSKHRDSMVSHATKLLRLLQEYPHSYEFYCENPSLSNLSNTLARLIPATRRFKPEGPRRNAIFTDAANSRKAKKIEGRQTYYVEQCSEGFMKIFGKPLHEIVAEVASLMFSGSMTILSAEDVRQRTTVKKKVQKSKKLI